MGLIARALGIRADGGQLENPAVPITGWTVLLDLIGGATNSGSVVNERSALQLSAVHACVRVIAETLASLPLPIYQEVGRGKIEAKQHRLYPLLHDEANSQMSAMVFREAVTAQVLLWGNGYAEITRDKSGRVTALWPLPSERTQVLIQSGKLWYETSASPAQLQGVSDAELMPPGRIRQIPAENVLHVPGLSFDGLVGLSAIRLARETIGVSMAADRFGALFFGNGSRPSGLLSHPKALRNDARERIERSFAQANSRENAQRAIVLEEGMTWTPLSVPPEDAQFLQTRQFQLAEIARIFRVPLHLIQDLSRSTNNNIEQQSIEFVTNTLVPWAVRWEQEIQRKLLAPPFFAKHDMRGLLRGDFQGRMMGYQTLRNAGVISANDIRENEGWNPIPTEEGGDLLLAPLNMTSLAKLAQPDDDQAAGSSEGDGASGGDGDEQAPPNQRELRRRTVGAFWHLYRDCVGRALARSPRDGRRMRMIFAPAMIAMAQSIAAMEFPHPRAISGAGHVLIGAHCADIEGRAATWESDRRDQVATDEAGRAYDALMAALAELTEEIRQ